MKISLKEIDLVRLDQAIAAVSGDHEGCKNQFTNQEAVELLKHFIGPFLSGVMKRLLSAQGGEELRLDPETLANMTNSLVQFGVAIGRHYELCNPEERIMPFSVSDAYEKHGQGK